MRMKLLSTLIGAGLLMSCGPSKSQKERSERVNSSALYDPPSVTLKEGVKYEFSEGILMGRGQRFHSHFRYLRAITIGK